jgi:hypothetical protein
MLGMPPQLDADIMIRRRALTNPNTSNTTGMPPETNAKNANRITTRASLNMTSHLSSVQHRQNVSAHGQQHAAIQMTRTMVATADEIIPPHQRPK